MKMIQTTYCKRFDNSCYRNICNVSFVSFSLAVIFIIIDEVIIVHEVA